MVAGRRRQASSERPTSRPKKATRVDGASSSFRKDHNFNVTKKRSSLMDVVNGSFQGESGFAAGRMERHVRNAVVEHAKGLRVYKSVLPFGRRVTALAWHPTEPTVCAAGSKGGSVLIWNHRMDAFESTLDTDHPGGSIQHMKFDENHPRRLFTCSIDGTFAARHFREGGGDLDTFLDTGENRRDNWYTSFDVSFTGKVMLVGDNAGRLTLMSDDGKDRIWVRKLHKTKVSHVGFSPREPWLFVTASIDRTVKVWDVRKMGDSNNFLQLLPHDKGVNNAEFSIHDGSRLLTTDQHSQLRVYRSPLWLQEQVLPHPHRQFQHLTPIKATWHPLVDLAIAGRYPDNNFPGTLPGELKTVDFLDPESGKVVYQLKEPQMNLIMSLNRFSPSGDALLSSAGRSLLVWKHKPEDEEAKYQMKAATKDSLAVEEWPGYKPPPKSGGGSKKRKVVE